DAVGVARVGDDVREIPGALADGVIVARARPGGPRVVGAEQPARIRLDQGPHPVRIDRRDGEAHLADGAAGQAGVAREFPPGVAAVRRLPDPAPRPAGDQLPGAAYRLPEPGVEDPRVGGVHGEVARAGAVALEEDLLPRPAAVAGAEHPA